MFPWATENAVARGLLFTHPCSTAYIEEWARRIEVNDSEHSLFIALRIGYYYVAYNVWNKTSESIF